MLNLKELKKMMHLLSAFLLEIAHRLIQSIFGDNLSFLRAPYWLPSEKGNILITGGDSGVGKAHAVYLAKLGYKVIITGHNQEKALSCLEDIRRQSNNPHVELYLVDFTSLTSVRSFARSLAERDLPIHVLVNNAGAIYRDYIISQDGLELNFQVNHAAPFLLTNLLLDNLQKASPPARIITVGSLTHLMGRVNFDELQKPRGNFPSSSSSPPSSSSSSSFLSSFSPLSLLFSPSTMHAAKSYNDTKLCVMMFARELQQKLDALGRPDILSLMAYPGGTNSEFGENLGFVFRFGKRLLKDPKWAARTQIYLTLAPKEKLIPGEFYWDTMSHGPLSDEVRDRRLTQSLWDYTARLVGI